MLSTSEKHKVELARFRDLLSKKAYQTQLLTASDGVTYDTLLVQIESFEEPNRAWRLEISFLPGLEQELESVSILQCFVALSDNPSKEHQVALNDLIVKQSAKLPIGSFGLLDNPAMLFFKHNALLPNGEAGASNAIVQELVPLI